MPTDTGYTFVSSGLEAAGVERILRLKGAADERKPLSLLCKDLATVDAYALGIDRPMFKLLKTYFAVPGPYTFILRAVEAAEAGVPRRQAAVEAQRDWRAHPSDPPAWRMLEQLDELLLCSTVPKPRRRGRLQPGRVVLARRRRLVLAGRLARRRQPPRRRLDGVRPVRYRRRRGV